MFTFSDSKHVLNYIAKQIRSGNVASLYICTFGMYVNENFMPSKRLIDAIKETRINVDLHIGLPRYYPCKDGCDDCLKKRIAYLSRVDTQAMTLTKKPIYHPSFHMKAFVLDNERVIIGGRNLGSSGDCDLSVLVDDWRLVRDIKVESSASETTTIKKQIAEAEKA